MKYFKLTKLQPETYEKIDAIQAIELYNNYLHSVNHTELGNSDLRFAKTFKDWLDTEI